MRLSLMINQRSILGVLRISEVVMHCTYILDQTYRYKNQRFLQSRRISCPRAETDDSRDSRQIFGAFIPSTETDIFAEFKILNFEPRQIISPMHATDCKC
jgi:hypothetical protein